MIILIPFFAGCSRITITQDPARIQTLPATVGSIRQELAFVGNVTSAQSSTLTWQTTGVISSVSVSLGDTVVKGQTIAELEADSLPAAVINAEVPLTEALDGLEETLTSETPKVQAY